ncbi:MAG: hypothetical protein AAGI63_13165 [Planctomycetota bacterium]
MRWISRSCTSTKDTVYFVAFSVLFASVGCGSGEQTNREQTNREQANRDPAMGGANELSADTRPAAFRERSAKEYLQAVVSRYQNAGSYHDRGLVQLTYRDGNEWAVKSAPIQVCLDHDQLYVAAYDVRIWRDDQMLTCWILDPETQNFDSQVVRVLTDSGRPQLQQLLSDRILTSRMTAGLAGPPPQLEWLFSPKPMQPLFEGEHQFRFGESQEIDGVTCQRVIVDDEFVFWIDRRSSTIRRVRLPSLRAPVAPGEPVQDMALMVDLEGASFSSVRDSLAISSLPTEPKLVKQFIPLPPPPPPKIIGARVEAFQISESSGQWRLTQNGSDRDVTLLMAFDGDATSYAMLRTIDHWQSNMPAELRRRMRLAVLADPSDHPRILRETTITVLSDRSRLLSSQLEISSGGLALMNREGVVSWVQPGWSAPSSEPLITLGAVLSDLIAGVDVAARMKSQWQSHVDAYQKTITEAQQPVSSDRSENRQRTN